ncbi:MAG: alpha/beta fold hydrolase [Sporolactobacillus sp.]
MTNYLILHGFGGSTGGHWQEWLAQRLQQQKKAVWFPQFTNWNYPDKATWLTQLQSVLAEIPKDEPLHVITHSLGCILWLHYAACPTARKVARVTFVSPPAHDTAIRELQSFFPVPTDHQILKKSAEQVLLITATNDPYLPPDKWGDYMTCSVPVLILPGAGHINVAANFGAWPWMLTHCLSENAAPLDSVLVR